MFPPDTHLHLQPAVRKLFSAILLIPRICEQHELCSSWLRVTFHFDSSAEDNEWLSQSGIQGPLKVTAKGRNRRTCACQGNGLRVCLRGYKEVKVWCVSQDETDSNLPPVLRRFKWNASIHFGTNWDIPTMCWMECCTVSPHTQHTLMFPRGWILQILVTPWHFR